MKKVIKFLLVLFVLTFTTPIINEVVKADTVLTGEYTEIVCINGIWYQITYDASGGVIEVIIIDPND